MKPGELREEIAIELELMEATVRELWNHMAEGIANVEDVFLRFKSKLFDYLRTLESR